MSKLILSILCCFLLIQTSAQEQRKISLYLFVQYNKTIYDATTGNNPWGVGPGLQVFYNNRTKFKPTIEFTADTYLEDDKLLRLTTNGKPIQDLGSMVNLFAGSSYHPSRSIYFSLAAGPAFINGNSYFGVKPSFGFYFSNNQRWTGKISYINIFNRNELTKEDFGSMSFAIGLKLF